MGSGSNCHNNVSPVCSPALLSTAISIFVGKEKRRKPRRRCQKRLGPLPTALWLALGHTTVASGGFSTKRTSQAVSASTDKAFLNEAIDLSTASAILASVSGDR